jgi:uracil-DNA glycosylase
LPTLVRMDVEAPLGRRLADLSVEAKTCRACPLWEGATQTVFGEGPVNAELVFVGEQPGDQEDRVGRPFVGPAGRLFDRALSEAGIERSRIYITNAVKHFKVIYRGKRRLHQRPNAGEIRVCRRWLFEEIEAIEPALIIALGATAAQSLAEKAFPIKANRGKTIVLANGLRIFPTVHPSSLLRVPDEAMRAAEYAHFVEDMRAARRLSGGTKKKTSRIIN